MLTLPFCRPPHSRAALLNLCPPPPRQLSSCQDPLGAWLASPTPFYPHPHIRPRSCRLSLPYPSCSSPCAPYAPTASQHLFQLPPPSQSALCSPTLPPAHSCLRALLNSHASQVRQLLTILGPHVYQDCIDRRNPVLHSYYGPRALHGCWKWLDLAQTPPCLCVPMPRPPLVYVCLRALSKIYPQLKLLLLSTMLCPS